MGAPSGQRHARLAVDLHDPRPVGGQRVGERRVELVAAGDGARRDAVARGGRRDVERRQVERRARR